MKNKGIYYIFVCGDREKVREKIYIRIWWQRSRT